MTQVPRSVIDAGTRWKVTRAWPCGDHVDLELTSPTAAGVRPGIVSAAEGARVLPAACDGRLPDLGRVAADGLVLSHRPAKRAVVQTSDGTFTKVVRPGRARKIVDGMAHADHFRDAFEVPEVLHADDATVTMSAVAGRSFHAWAGSDDLDDLTWTHMWRSWAVAWRDATTRTSADHLPVHGPEAEAAVLAEWAGRLPDLTERSDVERTRRAAGVLSRRLIDVVDPVIAPGHRDLHDKQLIWDATDGVALIDLDTAARCEPALDLANLRAHVRLRRLQGVYDEGQATSALAVIDDTAADLGVPHDRMATYELATLLRLGCLYAWRPAWVDVARWLRSEVATVVTSPAGALTA